LTIDGASIRDVLIGVGVLLAGIGIIVVCAALARLFGRLNRTLDEVDREVAALSVPVVATLSHIGGIADTADSTVARLGAVVGSLEEVAGSLGSTAKLATDAVAPALVNFGVVLAGITAGLRRFVSVSRCRPGKMSGMAERGGTPAFVAGLVLGALGGATLAMILAPQTGEETRDVLLAKAREAGERARDTAADASDLLARGRDIVADAKLRIDAAVTEGKDAAARQRDTLEHET